MPIFFSFTIFYAKIRSVASVKIAVVSWHLWKFSPWIFCPKLAVGLNSLAWDCSVSGHQSEWEYGIAWLPGLQLDCHTSTTSQQQMHSFIRTVACRLCWSCRLQIHLYYSVALTTSHKQMKNSILVVYKKSAKYLSLSNWNLPLLGSYLQIPSQAAQKKLSDFMTAEGSLML